MIASVVATIEDVDQGWQMVIREISRLPCVEVGDLSEGSCRVPITIDSPTPGALEDMTSQIQACRGVSFVDVVFVHFEDEPEPRSLLHQESQTAHER